MTCFSLFSLHFTSPFTSPASLSLKINAWCFFSLSFFVFFFVSVSFFYHQSSLLYSFLLISFYICISSNTPRTSYLSLIFTRVLFSCFHCIPLLLLPSFRIPHFSFLPSDHIYTPPASILLLIFPFNLGLFHPSVSTPNFLLFFSPSLLTYFFPSVFHTSLSPPLTIFTSLPFLPLYSLSFS